MASNPPPNPSTAPQTANIITALGNAFKSQSGEPLPGEHIAQLLIANMSQLGELAKQGKLSQQQIAQLKSYADKHKIAAAQAASTSATPTQASQPQQPAASTSPATAAPTPTNSAFKTTNPSPFLSASPVSDPYPISQTPSVTAQGAVQWQPAQQGRPSLTGGIPSGRVSGAPPQIAKPEDSTLNLDDNRTRRKNTPGDQSMRRSVQELVSSIDPNVKIEPEVEDLLLDIADEFIDSVTNFGCRLAKHRGGDTLEVKDLQLHLERNHNIRIPGFASDEARISLSQTTIAPAASATTGTKKGAQSTQMTLRSHRLSQVQFAKKEAKLM
ncbi:transcription initiation factor TFIID subunit A-domain-containing protein [Daedaleopsis nitida]|nr:transcription initiation factor TFIID subunit A-domain-containing protein [Daedaleopsis nitida]